MSESPDETADGSTTDQETETTTSTSYQKVVGETDMTDATGILGKTTAGSSVTYGVRGETQSSADTSTGVHGHASAGSGVKYGVFGEVDNKDSFGVLGMATTDDEPLPMFSDYPIGVYGVTDRNGDDPGIFASTAVLGWNKGSSGDTRGVWGRSDSASGYGVYGMATASDGYGVYSDGDSKTDGNHEITGSQSINELGIDVYLDSNVSVDDNATTIIFNQVRHDDVGEYDTSTGEFSPSRPGEYLVTAQVDWDTTDASEGDEFFVNLRKNGSQLIFNNCSYSGSRGETQQIHFVARDLTTSDTLSLVVYSDTSDGTATVFGRERATWFQVSKIA